MEYLKSDDNASFHIKDENFIRTGIPNDGFSFIQAIYYPFRHYRHLSLEDREIFIKEKIKLVRNAITLENWLEWHEGTISFLKITEWIRNNISHLYKNYEEFVSDNTIASIFFNLIDQKNLEEHIIPRWIRECSEIEKPFDTVVYINRMKHVWYQNCLEQITKSIIQLEKNHTPPPNFMTKEERLKVSHKLAHLSYEILDVLIQKSFEDFKTDILKDISLDFVYLSNLLKPLDIECNICIIEIETNQITLLDTFNEDNPTIILLSFDQQHYEPLGKVIQMEDNTKTISRLFSIEDNIISHIHHDHI